MKMHWLVALALSAANCGPSDGSPDLGSTPDSGPGSSNGSDAGMSEDSGNNEGAVDMGTADVGGTTDTGGTVCDGLSPAACMAEPQCTLDGGCREVSATDEAFQYLQTRTWVGTAVASGDKDFPTGDTEAVLSLFRSSPRDVRGTLHLPALEVRHSVWGGVGPTGELGLYLGTAECPDCSEPFGAAYEASGVTTDLDLTLSDIATTDLVDFRTVVSMQMSPSDGFKPVFPVYTRTDALVARWLGDFTAVDADGNLLSLYCEIEIDRLTRDGGYSLTSVNCSESDRSLEASQTITSADATSIAWDQGVGWLALGAADTDLMFVGRVGVEGPWEGVVVERGGVWAEGAPTDPGEVPTESLRGTFTFYPLDV